MAFTAPDTTDNENLAAQSAAAQRVGLRAKLRAVALDYRLRLCGKAVVSEHGAALIFSGSPGAWKGRWSGVLACKRIWTCPVCSAKLRAERLGRALGAMNALGGRWQMLTFTVRHQAGDDPQQLLRGEMRALARMRRVRAIGAIWKRAVTASVRATEMTFGRNGWNPHLHVLFRLKQLTSDERTALRHAWRDAVARELGEKHAPMLGRGLRLSKALVVESTPPEKLAGYLFKLGCEIAGVAKVPHKGAMSSWDVAVLATERDAQEHAWGAWSEFQVATKGRRMIELDDRAARAAKGAVILPFGVEIDCKDDTPPPVTRELELTSDELRALGRMERTDRFALIRPMLEASTAHDPCEAARGVIARAVELDAPPARAPP